MLVARHARAVRPPAHHAYCHRSGSPHTSGGPSSLATKDDRRTKGNALVVLAPYRAVREAARAKAALGEMTSAPEPHAQAGYARGHDGGAFRGPREPSDNPEGSG